MTAKRIILLASLFTMILIVFQGCYDATTLVIDNSPAVTKIVSFKTDLIPIFDKSCNMAGCHNTGGKQPDLTSDKAYASLTIGNYLNLASPNQSVVYLYLTGKKTPQMPLGTANNPSNINNLMLAWIQQGAKNN
jgi:hypothetical protein